MQIDGKDIDVDEMVKNISNEFHKMYGEDLFLTDSQIQVLEKNGIDYKKCKNAKELAFVVEKAFEFSEDNYELDCLSAELAEYNYYHNTNK